MEQVTVRLTPPPALIQAVRRLLRPLARALMAFGVNYPAFANLAKGVFVEAAVGDFREEGGPITDSQVSLLSGVHRREVKRLREEMRGSHAAPVAVSLGAQIVARWCADPRFMDAQRHPLPLARLASQGGDVSFERLVAGVSKDIRPRAVLDEWLRLGVARLDDEDRVHLLETAFIPVQGFDEKAFYFGKGLHDHMAAATHNVLGLHPPFLDRMTYYDGLRPESVELLRQLARELAARSLQEVNAKALELQAADSAREGANRRVTFGTYFYATEDERGGGK
ncbi:MAG: DUF6502 family protein [Pseudomonadota bacterium]